MTVETSEHPADIVQRKLRSLPDTVGREVLNFLDYSEQHCHSPQSIVKQAGLKQLLGSEAFKKRKSYDPNYIESHIQEERSDWD